LRKLFFFLLSKQNEKDGGWGESIDACVEKEYVQNKREGSQVVQTSWALIGLISSGEVISDKSIMKRMVEAADRAAKFLMNNQFPNGDWPQQSITGVFNKTCGISYTNYRNIFPIWALGKYSKFRSKYEEMD